MGIAEFCNLRIANFAQNLFPFALPIKQSMDCFSFYTLTWPSLCYAFAATLAQPA